MRLNAAAPSASLWTRKPAMDDEITIACLEPIRLADISIWLPPFTDVFSTMPSLTTGSWEHAEWELRMFANDLLPPMEMIVGVFFDNLPEGTPFKVAFHRLRLFVAGGEIYTANQQKVSGLAAALNLNLLRALGNRDAKPQARQMAALIAEFADIPEPQPAY